MKTNLTLNNTGYIAEKPVTMRKSGILDPTKYESRGGALTPLGMVRRHRRSPDMGTVRIPLSSRKYPNLYTVVDEQDAEIVRRHTWVPFVRLDRSGTVYAKARVSGKSVFLHRLLMHPERGEYIDHIDGDGLNNQRSNLRLCSNSDNLMNRGLNSNNRTGYKGVSKSSAHRWCARLMVNGETVWRESFDDPVEAARAYDRVAIEWRGEFARTNAAMGLLPEGSE